MTQVSERGSATVEFTVFTLILLIPIAYLFFTLLAIQQAAFASAAAARQGARIVAEARDENAARAQVAAIGELTATELGLESKAVAMQLECDATPCLQGGARIAVHTTIDLPLLFIPTLLSSHLASHVTLTSTSVGVVNPYLARP